LSGKSYLASIVVATYNRADMLGEALRSLLALEMDGSNSYEILVINDASTDNTKVVVEEIISNSHFPIRYFSEDGGGIARARNRGIEESSGDWIVFFDDDQIAETSWLKELLAASEKSGSLCVGGRVQLLFPEKISVKLPAFCRGLLGETHHGNRLKRFEGKTLPGTGNVMINRSIFNAIGCFNEFMVHGSEDAEFFRRTRNAGFEIWYAPKAVVYHLTPQYRCTEKYLTWTALRHGVSYAIMDSNEYSLMKVVSLCILRLAQTLIYRLPHLTISLLLKNDKLALQDRCLIARVEGYFRETLFLLSPRIFYQDRFHRKMNFRKQG